MSKYASPTKVGNVDSQLDLIEKVCRSRFSASHFLFNRETGQLLELNCKSWRCEKHASGWLQKWRIVTLRELAVNPIDRLMTLTCSAVCTPEQLVLAKQLLFRDLRVLYGEVEYLTILEFTTLSRLPHLHGLLRSCWIDQWQLSLLWEKATRSAGMKPAYITYIEEPRSQTGSAIYALSYALNGQSKEQDIPDSWRGRKVTYSKNFFKSASVKEHWLSWIRETFDEKEGGDDWELVTLDNIPMRNNVFAKTIDN